MNKTTCPFHSHMPLLPSKTWCEECESDEWCYQQELAFEEAQSRPQVIVAEAIKTE